MRRLVWVTVFALTGFAYAESGVSFRIAGRNYSLTGGHAVITNKNGKTQLIIGVKDLTAKAMFAITAELPQGALDSVQEISSEYNPVSLVLMSNKGVYTLAPHVTLARDNFIQYHKREDVDTGGFEDDPEDRPEQRIHECREHFRHSELCYRLMKERRQKRKKIRVEYKKHGPTWVGKSRDERIRSGDGVMRENKYRDTTLVVRITPTVVNGKLTQLTGSFGGVVVYNEGLSPAVKTPIQNGQFSVEVQNVP